VPERLSALGATLWQRTPRRWQWRILWSATPKFNVGLVAAVTNEHGRVLVLRHSHRGAYDWGLPTGWMRRGETSQEAVAREVREETGLSVSVGELLAVESGSRLRVELVFRAAVGDARAIGPLGGEVREARFVSRSSLPADFIPSHRRYIDMAIAAASLEEPAASATRCRSARLR
jgi:ADP-ribose pyrophosphatase YjhB (NUDIX family)